uniref:hypothetical protein n=1 Tax=Cobetia crustatorum TaxID=553385 RepID=UPI0016465E74
RVYSSKFDYKTAYELWFEKKPTVKYFRVFGSKCYILRDREHLGKFDTKSDEGIFLGYSLNSRAYRVLNKRTGVIQESINVVIDDHLNTPAQSSDDDEVLIIDNHDTSSSQKESEPRTVKDHPTNQILGNPLTGVRTRKQLENICNYVCFTSQIEPINVKEALTDENWIVSMQDELNQSGR